VKGFVCLIIILFFPGSPTEWWIFWLTTTQSTRNYAKMCILGVRRKACLRDKKYQANTTNGTM